MIRLLAAAALAAAAATPASAQTIAIVGGTVALGDGSEPIVGGTVVLRNGRIVSAGAGRRVPAGARIIDAAGKWVAPGMIAGFSRLGLAEVDLGADGADDTEANGSPFNAAIDIAPSINPKASTIAVGRADGVTRAIVAPSAGRSIFAGQGAVIDLGDDLDAVMRPRAFQFVELGEGGAGKAGGSRASAFTLFRNALREARDLAGMRPIAGSAGRALPRQGDDIPYVSREDVRLTGLDARRSDDVLLTRFDAAALVPVLRGQQLLLVHVERAVDIRNVLRLRSEFPALRLALVGATEAWMVAPEIARSGTWVIASALNDLPASFEQLAATQSNVGRLRTAGVKVAIGMIGEDDTRRQRNQRQNAGNLVAVSRIPGASGVRWGDAFAMVTSRPAQVMGLGDQIGSLKAGARADVVIWSGDPLENASRPEAVWIDGVAQPLDSHQTKLRDRYRDLTRRDLPEAYRR